MRLVRPLLLLLALLGAIVPMRHFLRWFEQNGWDLGLLIDAWMVNSAAEGMLYDLGIAALALIVGVLGFAWSGASRWSLVCIPITVCIGVGCALPLFLWFLAGARRPGWARAADD